MPKFLDVEIFRLNQKEKDYIRFKRLFAEATFKTAEAENMGTPSRLPKLEHPLIECSVCHNLRNEPNVEECEFCNEDVCDDCWDEHQCEQE